MDRGRFVTFEGGAHGSRPLRSTQVAAIKQALPTAPAPFPWLRVVVFGVLVLAATASFVAAIFWAAGGSPTPISPIIPADVVQITKEQAAAARVQHAKAVAAFRAMGAAEAAHGQHASLPPPVVGAAKTVPPDIAVPEGSALPAPAPRRVTAAAIAPPRAVVDQHAPVTVAPSARSTQPWVITVPHGTAPAAAPAPRVTTIVPDHVTRVTIDARPNAPVASKPAPVAVPAAGKRTVAFAAVAVPYKAVSAPASATPTAATRSAPFKVVSIVQKGMVLVETQGNEGGLVRAYRVGDKLPDGSTVQSAVPGAKTIATNRGELAVVGQ